jgi:hypothetical protein
MQALVKSFRSILAESAAHGYINIPHRCIAEPRQASMLLGALPECRRLLERGIRLEILVFQTAPPPRFHRHNFLRDFLWRQA